ncbi:MAG: hypothetical protein KAH09_01420 [Desulfobacula sp.]|nr:hypothetical protein [Desulfobacula sp.]
MVFIVLLPSYFHAAGVKTYYKQYSIFTHEDEYILCEPYQVKKDDWLYKIFRKKGEISKEDFPKFLTIFNIINPQIKNIDAIEPGITILIPLKKVGKQAYDQETPGIVEVPVIEFSATPDKFDIESFVRKHTIQAGDTVSTLLSKEFLKKGGAISKEAQKAFVRLNPHIKNIDKIYQGTQVVIPDPSILAQPWFETFLKQGRKGIKSIYKTPGVTTSDQVLPVIPPQEMIRLKRYSELIKGTLINQGQMYFPGTRFQPDLIINLSKIPVIESKDGQKTLIIPSDRLGKALGRDLVKNIKAYWKQVKIQGIDETLSIANAFGIKENSMADKPAIPNQLISKLLSATSYPYILDENIIFASGKIEMETSFGRIPRQGMPDLLVNMGNVYGLALEELERKGYQILTISPGLTMGEICLVLFTHLGYSTWKNPSFTHQGKFETLQGIYVVKNKEKLFIARQKPDPTVLQFLETKNIKLLIIDQQPSKGI